MKFIYTLLVLSAVLTTQICYAKKHVEVPIKINFKAKDGLSITADLYKNANPNAHVIVLCHQAGFSRGEYLETAINLKNQGYTCLALDQRSGVEVHDVLNETASEAKANGKPQDYVDALPDLEAALHYVETNFKSSNIMFVGSSYSSSLVIVLASKYPTKLKAIACFSPGEYFKFEKQMVEYYAQKVTCPVFITSAKNERENWSDIYKKFTKKKQTITFHPKSKGFHGSKALWIQSAGHDEYWNAFNAFLKNYFPSK